MVCVLSVLSARTVCVSKHKTAYEMRISDWSSDVCSSDLPADAFAPRTALQRRQRQPHHQQAAFQIGDTGAMQRVVVTEHCVLERTVLCVNRVEMTAEEDLQRRVRTQPQTQRRTDGTFTQGAVVGA